MKVMVNTIFDHALSLLKYLSDAGFDCSMEHMEEADKVYRLHYPPSKHHVAGSDEEERRVSNTVKAYFDLQNEKYSPYKIEEHHHGDVKAVIITYPHEYSTQATEEMERFAGMLDIPALLLPDNISIDFAHDKDLDVFRDALLDGMKEPTLPGVKLRKIDLTMTTGTGDNADMVSGIYLMQRDTFCGTKKRRVWETRCGTKMHRGWGFDGLYGVGHILPGGSILELYEIIGELK